MKRQVRLVAASGIATVLVIAAVIIVLLMQYLTLKRESVIALELSNGLSDLQYLTTEYLASSTPRALKQWQERHARVGQFLEKVEVRDAGVVRLLPEVVNRYKNLGSVFAKLIRIESTILSPERAALAQRSAISRLLNQVLALSALNDRISGIYKQREATFLFWASAILAVVLISGIALMVVLYVRVLRSISRNVEQLSSAIMRLGNGDFDEPVHHSSEGDIGAVFNALEQARVRLAGAIEDMENERADLDHFVYVASHDFKAPLRGIDNLASWIEEDAGAVLDNQAMDHLKMLRRRVKRLESLLEDLLAYSRAGRLNVPAETVNVRKLILGLVEDLNLPAGIEVMIKPEMPVIVTPKAPLAHVFFNLIGNAAKHHDKSTARIEIGYRMQDNLHCFSVSDDGPGIPEQYRTRIFEMFQTLKPRDVVEGSGMGLAIAKRLIQSYNGTITVIGDEGRGACFEFTWLAD